MKDLERAFAGSMRSGVTPSGMPWSAGRKNQSFALISNQPTKPHSSWPPWREGRALGKSIRTLPSYVPASGAGRITLILSAPRELRKNDYARADLPTVPPGVHSVTGIRPFHPILLRIQDGFHPPSLHTLRKCFPSTGVMERRFPFLRHSIPANLGSSFIKERLTSSDNSATNSKSTKTHRGFSFFDFAS